MNEVTLAADAGRSTGSSSSRRLRREGRIPAVLYGHGTEPVSLSVDARALRNALTGGTGVNALITLDVDGGRHLAMARQLQRHPVRGTVTHVDFVVVRRDEVVAADVPVHVVGEPVAVLRDGGAISQELFTLAVNTTPGDIPDAIEVDVTSLQSGGTIRVADVVLPRNVTTELDPDTPVVSATAGASAESLGEPAEGVEGEPDEGEAAAATGEAEQSDRTGEPGEREAAGDVSAGGDPAEG